MDSLAKDLSPLVAAARLCRDHLRERVGDDGLAALLGDQAECLDQRALDDLLDRAKQALDGAERIKNITKGLASFSRVERGDTAIVDLNRAAEHAATMASSEIRFRAKLVLDLGKIPTVRASEGKLAQVFLNLLVNSAHAIEEGGAEHNRITVRTWAEDERVFAEVSDTGSGIPQEDLDRIFEPFFTTKAVGRGTGLGLAITRSIVTELGGDIRVDSAVGQGTRFVVRLPIHRASPQSEEAVGARQQEGPAPSVVRGRVLVVDDEDGVRSTLTRMLRQDHEVVAARSGMEAKSLLEEDRRFDLILCDLMMPEMSGMDLHAWLGQTAPSLASRVVFVTGGAFTPRASEYLAKAGNLRLEKPFDPVGLRTLASRLVAAAKVQS
jgi:two-component system NtrC family sensor kinase